jgi:N-methylhydantoinase A
LVTLRVSVFGALEKPRLRTIREGEKAPLRKAILGETGVYFHEKGKVENVPIYRRDELCCNNEIKGPAVVVQKTSTTVLNPGDECVVDRFGNLMITWRER